MWQIESSIFWILSVWFRRFSKCCLQLQSVLAVNSMCKALLPPQSAWQFSRLTHPAPESLILLGLPVGKHCSIQSVENGQAGHCHCYSLLNLTASLRSGKHPGDIVSQRAGTEATRWAIVQTNKMLWRHSAFLVLVGECKEHRTNAIAAAILLHRLPITKIVRDLLQENVIGM